MAEWIKLLKRIITKKCSKLLLASVLVDQQSLYSQELVEVSIPKLLIWVPIWLEKFNQTSLKIVLRTLQLLLTM
jgi:hypothetical protein